MSIEKLPFPESPEKEHLDALKELFPEIFADDRINLDALKEILPEAMEDDDAAEEHYGLTWPGKRAAKKLATLKPTGTLVPMPGDSVDEENTKNIIIEGDNLEVLRILQKSYAGRIKMIYIDPPYNTGQDFIYKDDFKEPVESYLRRTGQADEEGLLTSNPKASGRYHSNWLSMMYPRLKLAKNLLRDDGVIFVSIDDNEYFNLRSLLNEIFGEENFISSIVIQANKRGQTYKEIAKTHEYILLYSRSSESELYELEKNESSLPFEDSKGQFDLWELRNRNPKFGRFNRPNLFFPIYVSPSLKDETGYAKVSLDRSEDFSVEVLPRNSAGTDSCWRWGQKKIKSSDLTSNIPILVAKQRRDGHWNIYEKSRKSTTKAKSLWDEIEVISEQGTIELGNLGISGVFDHPKPVGLVKKCLKIATEANEDIILDFFAGSGTVADAALHLNCEDSGNRKFILVQLPEKTNNSEYPTITHITRERARRVAAKIKGNSEITSQDLGFRSYRLSQSNRIQWTPLDNPTLNLLEGILSSQNRTLVDGWKTDDVVIEMMLLEGFPLDADKTKLSAIANNEVWKITHPDIAHSLLVCLDAAIEESTTAHLQQHPKEDIFICLDSALNDQAKLALSDALKVKIL